MKEKLKSNLISYKVIRISKSNYLFRLRKETLKNEEICKIELTEKQKRISLLEGSLDELERTNTVFLENLNRDNQTLQETLKNSEFKSFLIILRISLLKLFRKGSYKQLFS